MGWPSLVEQMDRACLKSMGVAIQYVPALGAAVDLEHAIFDASYIRVDAGQAGVSSATPMVFVRLSDLPSDPAQDDPNVIVDGVTYQVTEIQKDGQGGVRLILHKV